VDPSTWKKIEAILDTVLDLEPEKRDEYLITQIKDNHIRTEIYQLLEAEKALPYILRSSVNAILRDENEINAIAGSIKQNIVEIDRYKIQEEIGRGGMSVVYKARRTDGDFEQDVAVKIIQPFGLNREEQMNRLRTERQILANLQHPDIAWVFDGGITPEGWPYMVMELE